jgi:SEC-C motif-containing protein
MTTHPDQTPCPCGGPSLATCCGPRLDGSAPAETAEQLMRSRYTAYVVGDLDHVVATHDPDTRATVDRDAATAWSRQSQWLGLDVLATEAGGAGDATGVVEFVARFALGGRPQHHHERSRFKKVDEGAGPRWMYVDGETLKARPQTREAPKVGRNEPCPCGSGKKYKKCHGA